MRPGDAKGSCLEGREQRLPILGSGWLEGGREGGRLKWWNNEWMDDWMERRGGSGLVPWCLEI